MAGSRAKRPAASNAPRPKKPKGAVRATTGGSRRANRGRRDVAGGTGERGRQKRGAKVIPFPQGRRSRRSGSPGRSGARRAVGHWRLRLVVAVVTVVCLSLGARAAQLSIVDDENYQAFAAAAFAAEKQPETPPGRGDVTAADGRHLATSLDAAKVIATPYQVKYPVTTARALAEVLDDEKDSPEIAEKLTEKNDNGEPAGYSVVAEEIEPEKAREVKELNLPGVSVAPDETRMYPTGDLASQLVGYLGTDEAYGGVEARYDEVLKSGQDVHLTLDTAVQQELEGTLVEAAKKYNGKNALGLIMRAEDGAILALANVPGYDNNRFEKISEKVKRNRVLTDPYEPGSTFKPFTMAAALEEEAVTEETRFVVPDSIAVADRVIHDSENHETKILDPRGILTQSSNVGTIQVAQRLGGERLVEHVKRFGFGEGTGVDILGEDAGIIPSFEEWSGSTIGNFPVGQGLTVTPLQLAAGYATLANGGLRVTPYINEEAAPGEPGPRVISQETSAIVRRMLQSVVDEGTGELAQIPGYTVAGKTGTAQKVDPKTGLYGEEYVTSFIGFAPAENPEYLTLIVVDEPQKDLFGEVVAAPAFQKVMSFTLGYYNVPPDRESTKDDPPPPDPTPAPDAKKEDRIR